MKTMQCAILCDIAKFIIYYYHNLPNCLFILSKLPQYLASLCPDDIFQKKSQATLQTPMFPAQLRQLCLQRASKGFPRDK